MNRSSHFKNVHRNVQQIIVLQNNLNIYYNSDLSLEELETNIKNAYADKKKCKAIAESLSYEYRTHLALAKIEADEMKAATFLRTANNIDNNNNALIT